MIFSWCRSAVYDQLLNVIYATAPDRRVPRSNYLFLAIDLPTIFQVNIMLPTANEIPTIMTAMMSVLWGGGLYHNL